MLKLQESDANTIPAPQPGRIMPEPLRQPVIAEKKLLILGSCVSRDILNHDADKSFFLVKYFARSSIAAFCSREIDAKPDTSCIASPFQRRVVDDEIARNVLKQLPDLDLILIDLIDERFDLLELEPDAYLTMSNEFIESGYVTKQMRQSRAWVKSGSLRHRALWLRGIERLFGHFRRLGILHKVAVNKAFWSSSFSDDQALPDSYPASHIEHANQHLAWMYRQLERHIGPAQFLTSDAASLKSERHHAWGISPFHYVDRYYLQRLDQLHSFNNHSSEGNCVTNLSDRPDMTSLHETIASCKVLEDACRISFGIAKEEIPGQQSVAPSGISGISGNGRLTINDHVAKIDFDAGKSTYRIQARLARPFNGNGIAFRLLLSGWQSIRYVAIGYTAEEQFRHIKIVNIDRERWVDVDFTHDDLAFGMQNNWEAPDATLIGDVIVFISGQPDAGGASLELQECLLWHSTPGNFPMPPLGSGMDSYADCLLHGEIGSAIPPANDALLGAVYGYFDKCFRDVDTQADQFMRRGMSPMYGTVSLDWPATARTPTDLFAVGTYRFSWHALHPAVMLMMQYRKTSSIAYLFCARQFIESWLEHSFFQADEDKKYAWYDHGTAERLMALVLMWSIGAEQKFDHRFMARLLLAIHRHAVLLNSETFYASHQPTRYHNHAWFQDLALMITSLAMPELPCSPHWLDTAMSRLTNQMQQLIARDGGYAVFVENSIGYHLGVQRLVEFAGELTVLAGKDSLIPAMARELPEFSGFFRYPDKRAPANGDTFRRANPAGAEKRNATPYSDPACTLLPQAGYAVVKGNHGGSGFMLSVLTSSLCRTHKHEDNLSFTLFFDGLEWLIDPSFYSHEYAAPLPAYLRSAAAHNGLALPGRPYSIEPGKAKIAGSTHGRNFVIEGEHSAYEGVLIRRTMCGSIDQLAFDVTDHAMTRSPECRDDGLRLMFHCGEGVCASVNGQLLQLAHPASKYAIDIVLPADRCQLYFGEQGKAKIRGVAGLGFMRHTNVFTIECEVPFDSALAWKLEARMRAETP